MTRDAAFLARRHVGIWPWPLLDGSAADGHQAHNTSARKRGWRDLGMRFEGTELLCDMEMRARRDLRAGIGVVVAKMLR